jgi:hypothetical protein
MGCNDHLLVASAICMFLTTAFAFVAMILFAIMVIRKK